MSKKDKEDIAVAEASEVTKDKAPETSAEVLDSAVSQVNAEATEKEEPYIYLGPTIYGVATKGTIYNNGLPKELTDAMEKDKYISSLVVKISEANYVRAEIRKTGSAYNLFYNRIKK